MQDSREILSFSQYEQGELPAVPSSFLQFVLLLEYPAMHIHYLSSFMILMMTVFWPISATAKQEVLETSLELPADAKAFNWIRVLISQNIPSVEVSTPSSYRVMDLDGRTLLSGSSLSPTKITIDEKGFRFGPQIFRGEAFVIRNTVSGVHVGKNVYRDSIVISKFFGDKKRLVVVNELLLEDYLKGVLPHEVNPKWPLESLKAQAVAARTYALFKMIEKQKESFDVTNSVSSQVYGGKNAENTLTDRAINSTRGQILTYQSRIFPTYFHSTCGGTTTDGSRVWKIKPHPSLRGVKCEFCRGSKHYSWQETFPRAVIEAKLQSQGVNVKGIQSIRAIDYDISGRALKLSIEHAAGKTDVPTSEFRLWVDPFKFKSTLITAIQFQGDGFTFSGKGWGHGVGLCQYGIKQLGELGYSYKNILRHYYPDSDLISYGVSPGEF